jgi:hypothetical protein
VGTQNLVTASIYHLNTQIKAPPFWKCLQKHWNPLQDLCKDRKMPKYSDNVNQDNEDPRTFRILTKEIPFIEIKYPISLFKDQNNDHKISRSWSFWV